MNKQTKIETLEVLLGKRVYADAIVLGADVSVHSTGLALLRTTSNSLIIDLTQKITIPNNVIGNDALDLFISQLDDFKEKVSQKYKLNTVIIEDCFFGSNVKTLKSLARHSVLVYDRFKNIAEEKIFIMPKVARGKIGFKTSDKVVKGTKLKQEIIDYINSILDLDLKKEDTDIADAIVLGLSGLIYEEK